MLRSRRSNGNQWSPGVTPTRGQYVVASQLWGVSLSVSVLVSDAGTGGGGGTGGGRTGGGGGTGGGWPTVILWGPPWPMLTTSSDGGVLGETR